MWRRVLVCTSCHHPCPSDLILTEGVQLGHGFSVCLYVREREREGGRGGERERERERRGEKRDSNNVHVPTLCVRKTRLVFTYS